ncbi:RNA-directed DNA polymerase [Selenomonas noxia]|jgi:hypothetical protein|uniref:RNA-directed DNA polymerase n=3 Tax=Selenomonas noxia TaxID=135083 RepID=UPI0028D70848|nr:RNA-directed DNA polymerase [Selenomonas noxia]
MKKSYGEFMREIDGVALYTGLLRFGLFSEKLPPIFTSDPFYQYCQRSSIQVDSKDHDYIYFESMRNTNIPRAFGIPNPFAYEKLCRDIKENWDAIKQKLCDNTNGDSYRISRLHIRKHSTGKVFFEMNYKNWYVDESPEPDIRIGKRYAVKADISTCFPSIYTHSLPWALVGKETAKNNRSPEEWYNKVDKACQRMRNGETHGLMIGPHVSNLLSEIILTSIDNELKQKYSYIRKIDDYICYVSSMEEAQCFLTDLRECLQEFDLTINHKKTQIISLPAPMQENWVREINLLSSCISGKLIKYSQIRNYLDYMVDLIHQNGQNSAIFNYGIKVLAKKEFDRNARDYYVKTILHFAEIYPYLVPFLDKYVFVPCNISQMEIQKFSEKTFCSAHSVKNYEALYYMLYFAIRYDFRIEPVDKLSTEDYENSNSCLFKLLGWCYYKHHSMDDKVKMMRNIAKGMRRDNNVFDQNWIFIYEVLSWGLLKAEWKKMKQNGVSFLEL